MNIVRKVSTLIIIGATLVVAMPHNASAMFAWCCYDQNQVRTSAQGAGAAGGTAATGAGAMPTTGAALGAGAMPTTGAALGAGATPATGARTVTRVMVATPTDPAVLAKRDAEWAARMHNVRQRSTGQRIIANPIPTTPTATGGVARGAAATGAGAGAPTGSRAITYAVQDTRAVRVATTKQPSPTTDERPKPPLSGTGALVRGGRHQIYHPTHSHSIDPSSSSSSSSMVPAPSSLLSPGLTSPAGLAARR